MGHNKQGSVKQPKQHLGHVTDGAGNASKAELCRLNTVQRLRQATLGNGPYARHSVPHN